MGVIPTPLFAKIRGYFRYRIVVRQPTLEEIYRISEIVTSMGLTADQLKKLNILDAYQVANGNILKACQVMAICCRRKVFLSEENVIQMLFKGLTGAAFDQIWEYCLYYTGVVDFINTIRYMSPMASYLSPKGKGSQRSARLE